MSSRREVRRPRPPAWRGTARRTKARISARAAVPRAQRAAPGVQSTSASEPLDLARPEGRGGGVARNEPALQVERRREEGVGVAARVPERLALGEQGGSPRADGRACRPEAEPPARAPLPPARASPPGAIAPPRARRAPRPPTAGGRPRSPGAAGPSRRPGAARGPPPAHDRALHVERHHVAGSFPDGAG